ncbi:hypothetical protein ACVILK_000348 [Bradyrhizobium embrapense]
MESDEERLGGVLQEARDLIVESIRLLDIENVNAGQQKRLVKNRFVLIFRFRFVPREQTGVGWGT